MKRKELYNYIRGEVINELTETTYAGKGAVEKIKQDSKFKTLNPSAQTNAINDLNKGGDVELEEADLDEMARKAGAFKAGDKDKLATAKEIYTTGLYAKVLNAIEEAGENGLTQKELGVKLGINDTVLNPILNKFLTIGVFSGGKLAAVPKPEKPSKEEKPEVEEPETEEPVDTYYKGDEEEAPEEEPTVDIGAEKELGTAQAQKLSPEDEDKYAKLKKGVDAKIARLKGLSAAKRAASDDMKVLKQLSSRDDVKKLFKAKGVDIKDLIADL